MKIHENRRTSTKPTKLKEIIKKTKQNKGTSIKKHTAPMQHYENQ